MLIGLQLFLVVSFVNILEINSWIDPRIWMSFFHNLSSLLLTSWRQWVCHIKTMVHIRVQRIKFFPFIGLHVLFLSQLKAVHWCIFQLFFAPFDIIFILGRTEFAPLICVFQLGHSRLSLVTFSAFFSWPWSLFLTRICRISPILFASTWFISPYLFAFKRSDSWSWPIFTRKLIDFVLFLVKIIRFLLMSCVVLLLN